MPETPPAFPLHRPTDRLFAGLVLIDLTGAKVDVKAVWAFPVLSPTAPRTLSRAALVAALVVCRFRGQNWPPSDDAPAKDQRPSGFPRRQHGV